MTFEFLSQLVGDPISSNTLFEELFALLRMPYRIAPAERVIRVISENGSANCLKEYRRP